MNNRFFELMFAAVVSAVMFTSCLTINQKKIVEAPYVPESSGESVNFEIEKSTIVFFSKTDVPQVDGNFDEWKNLDGVHARQMVYGGAFDKNDAEGFFVLRTDGEKLFLYARVSDEDANVNSFEASQAWRGDSVEFFFGTDISKHSSFKSSDVRVRIIPRDKKNIFDVDIGINDAEVNSSEIKAACVFNDKGYEIEAEFPLVLLGGNLLKNGQKIRADFQVNDADDGKERTGLLHWFCPNDNTYSDPSGWGNGKVVELSSR